MGEKQTLRAVQNNSIQGENLKALLYIYNVCRFGTFSI